MNRAPQPREERMFLAWKGEKRRHNYRAGEPHSPLMKVARRFNVPVQVVRDAIEARRAAR